MSEQCPDISQDLPTSLPPNFDWAKPRGTRPPKQHLEVAHYVDSFSERPVIGTVAVMSLVESLAVSQPVTDVRDDFGTHDRPLSEAERQQLAVRSIYGCLNNQELAATLFGQPAQSEPAIAFVALVQLQKRINQSPHVLSLAEQAGFISDVAIGADPYEDYMIGTVSFARNSKPFIAQQKGPTAKSAARKTIFNSLVQIQGLSPKSVPKDVHLQRPQSPHNALNIWLSSTGQPELEITNTQISQGRSSAQARCEIDGVMREFTSEGPGRRFTNTTCMYQIIDAIVVHQASQKP